MVKRAFSGVIVPCHGTNSAVRDELPNCGRAKQLGLFWAIYVNQNRQEIALVPC